MKNRTALNLLLACGIISSVLYLAMNIFIPMQWQEYSSVTQTISELSAIGAPTRTVWMVPCFAYTALVTAFGYGVWAAGKENRRVRVMGGLLLAYGLTGLLWPFAPMHLRGGELTLTDAMHITLGGVTVLVYVAALAIGAGAFGKRFRLYSFATLAVLIVSGIFTGIESPNIASDLPTPTIGVWERISIGVVLLWMAVLAVVLMRSKPARAPATASGASEANAKKKVTAFVGCASKKHTFKAVQRFLDQLKAPGDVEVEVVALSDYRIGICRGCKVCFLRGEESCPLKDDRDLLIQKMMASDGVIFATPNYSFQVSAQLKLLLDRLGFVFHRPRFFGKAFTSIVVQGFYGAGKIERYLDFVGAGLGFSTVKGSCITALEPMTEAGQREMEKLLAKQVRRFRARLFDPEPASPSLIQLIGFRAGRTCSKLTLNEHQRDYTYYRDNGWFDSDYFHPVRLGLIKRAVGAIFDRVAARKYSKQPQAPDLGPSPDAAQAHE